MKHIKKTYRYIKKHWKAFISLLVVTGLGIMAFLYRRQGLDLVRLKMEADLNDGDMELDNNAKELDNNAKELEVNAKKQIEMESALIDVKAHADSVQHEIDSMDADEKLKKFKELGY